jgi:hypothetical protein
LNSARAQTARAADLKNKSALQAPVR